MWRTLYSVCLKGYAYAWNALQVLTWYCFWIAVVGQIRENEAVKLIRIKEGLLKLSDSYLELAHKCCIIHEAHRDIARQIPDVHGDDLHDLRYAGIAANNSFVKK